MCCHILCNILPLQTLRCERNRTNSSQEIWDVSCQADHHEQDASSTSLCKSHSCPMFHSTLKLGPLLILFKLLLSSVPSSGKQCSILGERVQSRPASPRRAVPRLFLVLGDPPAVTRIRMQPLSSQDSDWPPLQRSSLGARLGGRSE